MKKIRSTQYIPIHLNYLNLKVILTIFFFFIFCHSVYADKTTGYQEKINGAKRYVATADINFEKGSYIRAILDYESALRLLYVTPFRTTGSFSVPLVEYELGVVILNQTLAGEILQKISKSYFSKANKNIATQSKEPLSPILTNCLIAARAAITLLEGVRMGVEVRDIRQSLELAEKLQYSYDLCLFIGSLYNSKLDLADGLFQAADKSKARLLLDLIWRSHGKIDNKLFRKWYSQKYIEEMLKMNLEKIQSEAEYPKQKIVFMQGVINKISRDRTNLEKKLLQKDPDLFLKLLKDQAQRNDNEPWDVRPLLKKNETLLEYRIVNNVVLVFVLKNGEKIHVSTLKNLDDIKSLIRRYLVELSNPNQEIWEPESRQLFLALIRPVQHMLHDTHRLIIVPDKIISLVPFQMLTDPLSKKTLLEDYLISYLPSARLKFYLKDNPFPIKRLLTVGINKFTNQPPLKFGEDEVVNIARNFSGPSTVYLGSKRKATIKNILNGIQNHDILHISTHGFYEFDNPLFSHLVLQDQLGKDKTWSAYEIFGTTGRTDLVVLSACSSNISATNYRTDEDLLALPQAFLYSGAKSVIASLWNVSESNTQSLMQEFYHNANKTGFKNLDQALRSAQLTIKKANSHPYAWAGFILIGDSR